MPPFAVEPANLLNSANFSRPPFSPRFAAPRRYDFPEPMRNRFRDQFNRIPIRQRPDSPGRTPAVLAVSSHVTRHRPLSTGFTLIELLVVMGIILLLVAALVPAVTSLSKSNNLNAAGRMVSNVLTVARSEAINRRGLIRFEVATSWPGDLDAAYRKFTLVQHDLTSGVETQLTKWETLPAGVIFNPQDPNPGSGSYLFSLNQVQDPPLKAGTQTIPTVYIEFVPTGALNVAPASSPVRLRLVQGFLASASATSVTSTGPNNWFDTSIDSIVGRIKIVRP